MTQVVDRVALPIRVHDLLLGLAGRLDDDGLTQARELLASAEVDRALELIAGCLNAGRIPLTSAERGELRALFAESHLDTFLVEHLSLGQTFSRHRFHHGPPGRSADQGVGAAIRQVLEALPDVRAVWAVWRTTPAGAVAGPVPQRIVVVEIGTKGSPPATSYRIEHALRRAGIRAVVEVIRDGSRLTEYHRQAMRHARRVLSDEPDSEPERGRDRAPERSPDRVPDRVPAPVMELPGRDAPARGLSARTAPPRDVPSRDVAPIEERRPSWRDRREPEDHTAELEQSEPVTQRSSSSYSSGAWRRPQQDEPVTRSREPEPVTEPAPEPIEPVADARPGTDAAGIQTAAPADLPAEPVADSRADSLAEARAESFDAEQAEPEQDRIEPPRIDQPRIDQPSPLETTTVIEPVPALASMDEESLVPPPVPPAQSSGASRDGADDGPGLNEQEKDLLRQLQEELAKRERAEEADRLPWRTDAGRHHDGDAKWATGSGSRIVNGVPRGSGGGEPPRFPSGA